MTFDGRIQLFPMVRVALALMLGVVAGDALHGVVASWMWMGCMVVVLLLLLVWSACSKRLPIVVTVIARTIVVLLAVAVAGAWRMSVCADNIDMELPDGETTLCAVVAAVPPSGASAENATATSDGKPKTSRYELVVVGGYMSGHTIYAYFPADESVMAENARLNVGDGVEFSSRLRPAVAMSGALTIERNGSTHFNYARWLMVHDIVARTYVAHGKWRRIAVGLQQLSGVQRLRLRLSVWRCGLLSTLRSSELSSTTYSVVAAMVFGDKRSLDGSLRDSYSVSGASHVLALSGMHLSVIYVLLSLILARGRRQSYMQAAVLAAVWGYVVLVGMPPSVVRSALMCTMFTLFSMLGRDRVSLNTLGLSAVLLLAFNPTSFWDVGFQMSFLAVAGILVIGERFGRIVPGKWLLEHRFVGWLWAMCIVSVSAQVMVAPLAAYYFGRFSSYFLLSNLVAVPLATAILYSSVAMCAVMFVPCMLRVAVQVVDFEVSALNDALRWIASLPGASIENIKISGLQLLLVYVLIALVYAFSFYFEKAYRSAHGFRLEKYVRGRRGK